MFVSPGSRAQRRRYSRIPFKSATYSDGQVPAYNAANNDFEPSGNVVITGAFTQSGGAFSLTGNANSSISTASTKTLTITAGAASTWSTSAGALTLNGVGGINLQLNGTTIADVGVTGSTALTLAANMGLVGAAGSGALSCNNMTGPCALPTGNFTWNGATGKLCTLTSSFAGITITAAHDALVCDGSSISVGVTTATSLTIGNGSLVTTVAGTLHDDTAWNVSTTAHGFVPKLPNDATQFLNGVGAFSVPGTAAANVSTNYIYGFPLSWVDATHVMIGFPNANGPTSLARDAADAAFMSLAAGTTYTINTATTGAVLGDDSFQGAGTVAFNNGTTITGTSTAFTTAFGTRTVTGTSAVTGGTALVGTGTKYLTEVAVNDLVGNATGGWARVTAITDDTHLTLSQTMTLSSTCSCIEQPTITLTGDTATGGSTHQVDKIASDTSLLITEATAGGSLSGKTYFIGRHYTRAAVSAAQYGFVHVVSGATGTSAVISTQRTKTFAQAFGGSSGITGYLTSYRRVGSMLFDGSGNVVRFWQTMEGSTRSYWISGQSLMGSGTQTNFTQVNGNTSAPPTTQAILCRGFILSASTASDMYIADYNGVTIGSTTGDYQLISTVANAGFMSMFGFVPCDGAQRLAYRNSAVLASGSNIQSYGYRESI